MKFASVYPGNKDLRIDLDHTSIRYDCVGLIMMFYRSRSDGLCCQCGFVVWDVCPEWRLVWYLLLIIANILQRPVKCISTVLNKHVSIFLWLRMPFHLMLMIDIIVFHIVHWKENRLISSTVHKLNGISFHKTNATSHRDKNSLSHK